MSDDKRVKMLPASAWNRPRVHRVAGDNSTTEPPMLAYKKKSLKVESMVLGHRN